MLPARDGIVPQLPGSTGTMKRSIHFGRVPGSLAAPLRERLPWGWKDPRTSLTLPFWRSAFGPLRTVVVVRNPLEVVTSLYRRNGFSTALALTLWQIYAERALEDTSPDGRLVTHYDSYFFDPDREITRVLDFLGLNRDQDLPSIEDGGHSGTSPSSQERSRSRGARIPGRGDRPLPKAMP